MSHIFGEKMVETFEEMILIPKKEYDQLIENQKWLRALEAAGVDNWEGCDFAKEALDG